MMGIVLMVFKLCPRFPEVIRRLLRIRDGLSGQPPGPAHQCTDLLSETFQFYLLYKGASCFTMLYVFFRYLETVDISFDNQDHKWGPGTVKKLFY